MQDYIIKELGKTRSVLDEMLSNKKLLDTIEEVSKLFVDTLQNGKKVMFCGNGGSAADSQHLAAELVSRLCYDRPALNALALTVDTSALTAIGNDYGYDRSFARQIEAVGQEGDVLVGISTSGRSKNVLAAIESAKARNIKVVGFLGEDGRDIGGISDYSVNIPSGETPKIQEGHIAVGHIICALTEEEIFGEEYNPKRKSA